MPVAKGEKKIQHTDDQKEKVVERVCEMYESQNATIESCCQVAGISSRVFNLWCAKNSDFAERYKKAKEVQDKRYWEEIIKPLAKTALQKHLEVEFSEEERDVVYEGVKTGEIQKTKKFILPNPTISIFALKGLYPSMFADRHELSGPDGGEIPMRPPVIIELSKDDGKD
jgi:hypothetical protein